MYYVLATSGWQGDSYTLAGSAETVSEKRELLERTRKADAQLTGYITVSTRQEPKSCTDHGYDCWLFNLRGKRFARFEPHLRGKVHVRVPMDEE